MAKKFISLDELKVFKDKVYEKFIKKPEVDGTKGQVLKVVQLEDGSLANKWADAQTYKVSLIDDDTLADAGQDIDLDNLTFEFVQATDLTTKDTLTLLKEKVDGMESIERKQVEVVDGVATLGEEDYQTMKIDADTLIHLPNITNKVVLDITNGTKDNIVTFQTSGTDVRNIKYKLKLDSYNVFTINLNEGKIVINKESDSNPELTDEDIANGIEEKYELGDD